MTKYNTELLFMVEQVTTVSFKSSKKDEEIKNLNQMVQQSKG